MSASTPVARAPRARLSVAAPRAPRATIVPSAPQLFPLRQLVRAKENVRHIRIDEGVDELTDNIRAHGLLQSLIGYLSEDKVSATVHIAGGGRRLQALDRLMFDGDLDGDFLVPVLIRDKAMALELSLAENLEHRNMSPVDEFLAFKALIDTGNHTPAALAKRFGFSERVVKQRLRLARLAPEVLSALADREITIDAAMAYAGTQDATLQAAIFNLERKRPRQQHATHNIRHLIDSKGMRASHPLYRYVGADAYEQRGGRYEDGLFRDDADGPSKILTAPILLQTIAAEQIEFEMLRLLADLRADPKLSPSIDGYVVVPGLMLASWGHAGAIPTSAGRVAVSRHEHAPMWRTIRNNEIPAQVVVGINDAGKLVAWPGTAIVPKSQRNAVAPAEASPAYAPPSPEQIAEAARVRGVLRWSRQLAVYQLGGTPLFAGTALEGRAWWTDRSAYGCTVDGVQGMKVPLDIFVTDAEVDAQRKAAEARYRDELVEQEARAADRRAREADADRRLDELRAIAPPAIVAIDGAAWERLEDGSYAAVADDAEPFASWLKLLNGTDVDAIGPTFATREAWLENSKGTDV